MTDTSAPAAAAEPNEGHGPEVLYEVADHLATITLNRPHRRNAISARMLQLLTELFAKADDSPEVRVVLLTGALLGPRLGFLTMALYLGEGLAGLPVFAEGHSAWTPGTLPGVPVIFGLSAGYLVSYPFAAAFVGWLAERGWDRKPLLMLAAMLLGSLIIFAFGAGWLGHLLGYSRAFSLGVLPFLPGDVLKALLAAGLLPAGWSTPADEATLGLARALRPAAHRAARGLASDDDLELVGELAAEARNRGNTPVGSVVVLDGAIIGQGIETPPTGPSITGHAERRG